MKTIIGLLLILFISPLLVQAQEEIDTNIVFECIYVLDETWTTTDVRHYKTDQKPNVFTISDNVLYFQSRIRENNDGQLTELKELTVDYKDSVKTITFYGKNLYRGKSRLSGIIEEYSDGSVKIHLFTKLGSYERFYLAHKASEAEIKEMTDFNKR